MSEPIDWLVISSWSGLAALQFGSTVKELLKAWRERHRDNTNDFGRIIKGETRRGWRQVLRKFYPNFQVERSYFSIVSPSMKNFEDQQDTTTPLGTTVTVVLKESLLDDRTLLSIVRRSLIRDAQMSIAKLIFDPLQLQPHFQCFLNIRTIAIAFESSDSRFRLVLVDTARRCTRKFVITCPRRAQYAYQAYKYVDSTRNGRLHVLFGGWKRPENDDGIERYKFFDAAYDLPLSEEKTKGTLEPRSWESISIPVGNRYQMCCTDSDGGLTVMFYNKDSLAAGNDRDHLCVSFDTKTWRVETLVDWMESFRNTQFGPQILEAAREFSQLSVPDHKTQQMPAKELFWSICPYPIGGAVLAPITRNGYFRRLISPPSLKRRAAEASFKAAPKLEAYNWKEETGFEVLDGISEDVKNDDVDVIEV